MQGQSVRAGLVYFGWVFALGFVLGTLRVLVISTALGEVGAVIAEIPVMLGASWLISGWVINRFDVPKHARPRLLMGGTALALLLMAELALSLTVFERSLIEHFRFYLSLHGALGLWGQIIFGFIPLARLKWADA